MWGGRGGGGLVNGSKDSHICCAGSDVLEEMDFARCEHTLLHTLPHPPTLSHTLPHAPTLHTLPHLVREGHACASILVRTYLFSGSEFDHKKLTKLKRSRNNEAEDDLSSEEGEEEDSGEGTHMSH